MGHELYTRPRATGPEAPGFPADEPPDYGPCALRQRQGPRIRDSISPVSDY